MSNLCIWMHVSADFRWAPLYVNRQSLGVRKKDDSQRGAQKMQLCLHMSENQNIDALEAERRSRFLFLYWKYFTSQVGSLG